MKKIIIIAVIAVVGIYGLISLFSSPEVAEVGEDGEVKTSESGGIFNKVKSILPGDTSRPNLGTLDENDPHVVVIKPDSEKMDVEDVIEGIESRTEQKSKIEGNTAVDFARWAVFSPQYTEDERAKIFERSLEILNNEESQMLARDVVYSQRAPDLYEKALQYAGKDMNQKQLEELIRDLLPKTKNPTLKSQLTEFAATRNIYVR